VITAQSRTWTLFRGERTTRTVAIIAKKCDQPRACVDQQGCYLSYVKISNSLTSFSDRLAVGHCTLNAGTVVRPHVRDPIQINGVSMTYDREEAIFRTWNANHVRWTHGYPYIRLREILPSPSHSPPKIDATSPTETVEVFTFERKSKVINKQRLFWIECEGLMIERPTPGL
jgi:hypothetical protein